LPFFQNEFCSYDLNKTLELKKKQISDVDKGVSKMASMLNITRIHNSMWAVANMRRTVNLARDYATKRFAFGKLLIEHDLHNLTLGNMEVN
jgi:acyl-CoA dehydrogenase